MRRFLPTLIVLIALFILGGYGIYQTSVGEPLFTLPYPLTPFSADPQTAQTQALMLVGGGAVLVAVMLGMAAGLAFAFDRIPKLQAAPRPAEGAKPAPKTAAGEPQPVPLAEGRSLTVFWVAFLILGVGFLVLRNWGISFGYLPLAQLAQMPVLKLPGQHIEGLPAFIAGPGDSVTALQLLIGVLGGAVAGTLLTGFVLAQVFARLDGTLKAADKLKPTVLDKLIAFAFALPERIIENIRSPKPKQPRKARSLTDRSFALLNLLAAIAIVAIVIWWVIPSLRAIGVVNQDIEATRTATQSALLAEWAALPAGDAVAGQAVFEAGGVGACGACHSLVPDQKVVGPSLAGMATRAASRRPGYSAEAYLYESVTQPNAYIVDGFPADTMPQDFKTRLTPQQLADVIAFLLTQR